MPSVEISIEDARWDGLDLLARKALDVVAEHSGVADLIVSVLGCDDERISGLNAEFRGKPAPTNVLSWPSEDVNAGEIPTDPEIGDIAIAFETCVSEANAQGKPFDDHVTHLLIHGILHLLGYDHQTDTEAAQMENLETALLAKLGIDDPYKDRCDQ